MGIIYCWKLGDEVVYVGRTIKSLEERSNQHISEYYKQLEKNITMTYKFQKVSELHNGWAEIKFETIEEIENEELGSREQYWYDKYSDSGLLWNANRPPSFINYSDPVDIKERMLKSYIKDQYSKISEMVNQVSYLMGASSNYFFNHVYHHEVTPKHYYPNPSYNNEYLDITSTILNLLDEFRNSEDFTLLMNYLLPIFERYKPSFYERKINVKKIITRYSLDKNYESIESLMDEALSSGKWIYGKKAREEPKDRDIFNRFDEEFRELVNNVSAAPNSYESNPHFAYYLPRYVRKEERWKYQEGNIIIKNQNGLSDINHQWVYVFDLLVNKYTESDNFYALMTYLRGKNAGRMNKFDKLHNRIETNLYCKLDSDIREAIFNKHYYKYDNVHDETYIELVKPIIETHIKYSTNIKSNDFIYIDDIVRKPLDIMNYIVIKKG